MIPRVHEPIDGVAMLSAAGRCTGSLTVVGYPDLGTPIGITLPDDSLVGLTLEQLDTLMERLGQARADVVRIQVAALAGGAVHERTFRADELVKSSVPHHAWICTDRRCATRLTLSHDPRLGTGRAPTCERCGALTCPVNPDVVPERSN